MFCIAITRMAHFSVMLDLNHQYFMRPVEMNAIWDHKYYPLQFAVPTTAIENSKCGMKMIQQQTHNSKETATAGTITQKLNTIVIFESADVGIMSKCVVCQNSNPEDPLLSGINPHSGQTVCHSSVQHSMGKRSRLAVGVYALSSRSPKFCNISITSTFIRESNNAKEHCIIDSSMCVLRHELESTSNYFRYSVFR